MWSKESVLIGRVCVSFVMFFGAITYYNFGFIIAGNRLIPYIPNATLGVVASIVFAVGGCLLVGYSLFDYGRGKLV